MKHIRQRKLLKLTSGRLKKAGWALVLDMVEARKSNALVALAESTLVRFVDQISGTPTESIHAEEDRLSARIRELRALPSAKEYKAELRQLVAELNRIQFLPELVLVVMESPKDYRRAVQGFTVNGTSYHRLLATSAGVKVKTIVFAADPIRAELLCRLDNGRQLDLEQVPAKLESYKGLTLSSSTPVSAPNGVVVVHDCITHFKDSYIQLSDGEDGGEPRMETIVDGEVDLDNSDGYGLISPALAEIWSAELGLSETACGFCIRNAFCKGMVFPFDFVRFAGEVAHCYEITDVWGQAHSILDTDLILTESQLKLWESYGSIGEYLQCCRENGYGFSVTKAAERKLKESRELNYQFIQSYQLSDEDIAELVAPTMEDLAGVMGGDPAKAVLYLKGTELSEKAVRGMDDDCVKALMVDDRVLQDPYVRGYIGRLISKRGNRAKLGRIRVRGDYMVVSGDPYALCQSAFGLTVTGLLAAGEVYARYWIDRGINRVVCFRAPMTIHNNIRAMEIHQGAAAMDWYRYLGSVLVINAWDQMASSLNGMDMDGDTVLSTDNAVLLRNTRQELPICCQQRKADKRIAEESDLVDANLVAFGDSGSSIGSITNRATEMWDRLAEFPADSREAEVLRYRLTCSQHYQQNSIDRAKGILSEPMPTWWHNRSAAAKRDADTGDDLQLKIVADKKPYFMRYRYSDTGSQWNKYRKKSEFDCQWKFGCSPEELMEKEVRTDEEESYLYWYYRNSPVSLGNSVMNRLCRMVEAQLKDIRNCWSSSSQGFDHGIYRCQGVEYSQVEAGTIRRILDEYRSELKTLPGYARANNMEDAAISEYRQLLLELAAQECWCACSSAEALCNIVVDYVAKHSGAGAILWELCGDTVVRNLLRQSGGTIRYYEADPDGDINYKGQRFAMRQLQLAQDIKEDSTDAIDLE